MYGQNPVASPLTDREHLIVNDLFYTLQGEGPDAGHPAIFLRLAHCNLRCWFCDTEFDTGNEMPMQAVRRAISKLVRKHNCNLLVITGGEPLLQNVAPLLVGQVYDSNDYVSRVSIETAGTTWHSDFEGIFDPSLSARNKIVCSPKTPKLNAHCAYAASCYKYIIKAGEVDPHDGLPIMSTQLPGEEARLYRPTHARPIYIQPCDENDLEKNQANLLAATESALKYGYRLSVQLHKLAGLP